MADFIYLYWTKNPFFHLTGIDLDSQLLTVVPKAKTVISYMKYKSGNEFYFLLTKLEKTNKLHGNNSADFRTCILRIISYFHEKDCLLYLVEENLVKEIIEADENLPLTPCLVCKGTDKLSTLKFRLCVDKNVLDFYYEDFKDAFSCLFASYFILGLQYPHACSKTLEFLQSFIFGLNTGDDKGSKVALNKRKSGSSYPIVLKFHDELVSFNKEIESQIELLTY